MNTLYLGDFELPIIKEIKNHYFNIENIEEFKTICPKAEIKLVDGEFFAWYGSRMIKAADYFHQLCDSNSNVSE